MPVRKKVLLIHFNRRPPITGGEYVYCKISEALSTAYELTEISTAMVILKYFKTRGLKRALARYILEPISILYPLLVRKKYDLIFTSWSDEVPFYGNVVYAQPPTGSTSKKPFTITDHGRLLHNVAEYFGKGVTWPWRILFGRFSIKYIFFISNSKFTMDYILNKYNKRSYLVYPPVKVDKLRYIPQKKERIVLSIGTIIHEKRFDLIGKIGTSFPDVKFILIGKADEVGKKIVQSIENEFAKSGLANNFSYLGYISDDEKVALLEKASVIFHPAIGETFGISLVEGMVSGAVPVAHNSGGPSEFINSEWLFNSDAEIKEKLTKALDAGPSVRRALREKGMTFSEQRFKDSILRICDEIIKSKYR
ncbi:MAG: glycosyltransferase [Candidatus Methanosuratincola sp.]